MSVIVDVTGWAPLAPGWEVTVEPLRDPAGGYVHLCYREALEVVASLGAELPTREQIFALHAQALAIGLELQPIILPTPAMVRAVCAAPPGSSQWEIAAQQLRTAEMSGRAWCVFHDELVQQQLRARRWNRRDAVANAGKPFCAGAAPGMARICGWWSGSGFIQLGLRDQHNDMHHDYATTTIAVRRAA